MIGQKLVCVWVQKLSTDTSSSAVVWLVHDVLFILRLGQLCSELSQSQQLAPNGWRCPLNSETDDSIALRPLLNRQDPALSAAGWTNELTRRTILSTNTRYRARQQHEASPCQHPTPFFTASPPPPAPKQPRQQHRDILGELDGSDTGGSVCATEGQTL